MVREFTRLYEIYDSNKIHYEQEYFLYNRKDIMDTFFKIKLLVI
jgi:hypothetical protein